MPRLLLVVSCLSALTSATDSSATDILKLAKQGFFDGGAFPSATTTSKPTPGPYAALAKSLPPERRKLFYKLMQEMKASKSKQSPGLSDSQKNATRRSFNGEMQKLLGDEAYQKYRAVRVANTAKIVASYGKAKGDMDAAWAAYSASAPAAKNKGIYKPVSGKAKGKGKGAGKAKGKGAGKTKGTGAA